ncbi:DinB family protein [Paenibacillus mendelii]|uniref:DinB family protein n=1 Tax=Paenibacillus mendelii TaxID=206163 RepID=A0ABV6JL19_9BACL|nr:DinB family protein [Paenibacillus mendelii]MCQ6562370.1 DinB family protein [Paenibacillus mendelii]
MSVNIINTAKSVRQITLHQVQSIPEELFDHQPEPFNNTIRWNVGHIVFCLDHFLSGCFQSSSHLPESYAGLFHTGTKPSEWSVTPPSKEELLQQLSAQLNRISEVEPAALEGLLPSPVTMGPLRFETAGELFNFAFIHEAIHHATISCLLKVIRHNQH